MAVSYERVEDSDRSKFIPLTQELTDLARNVFIGLIREYPELHVSEQQVRDYYNYDDVVNPTSAASTFRDAILGKARNKLGERQARVYVAREGGDPVGWLITAEDHSNNVIKRRLKSYLWLVSGGVETNHQGTGVMSTLLEAALTDKDRPRVKSLTTHTSAYPLVLDPALGITLPAERGLQHLGFEQTGEPFEHDAVFGVPRLLRRYESASPEEVATRL